MNSKKHEENTIICRCSDVSLNEVRDLINDGYTEPDEIKSSLVKQLDNPVRWSQSIQNLIADGIDPNEQKKQNVKIEARFAFVAAAG